MIFEKIFYAILKGGRGGAGRSSLFYSDGGFKSDNAIPDYPARFNVLGVRSEEKTLAHFKQLHNQDEKESAIFIDSQGFTHTYTHGNSGSVAIRTGKENGSMIHNHPNGSAFSGADLKAFSSIKNINRLYATGTKGTYQITKGQRFNEKTFLSKINKAKGKVDTLDNYNMSVRRLLNNKNFQKEAGFTFKYTND